MQGEIPALLHEAEIQHPKLLLRVLVPRKLLLLGTRFLSLNGDVQFLLLLLAVTLRDKIVELSPKMTILKVLRSMTQKSLQVFNVSLLRFKAKRER